MKPRVLILHTLGTNRDEDAAAAFAMAGAEPCIVPIVELKQRRKPWSDYQLLMLPGGFSYADALGAGRLWALDLQSYFADELEAYVGGGRPVLGICNGFQALVRAGVLPGDGVQATLTHNETGRFECRWVTIRPHLTSLWTAELAAIDCPIAHGEGNFQLGDPSASVKVAFTYAVNPNGSHGGAAGVSNGAGNVLGLMPHPENHIYPWQHPHYPRGYRGNLGLPLFQAGVKHA